MVVFKETTIDIGTMLPGDIAFVNFEYTGERSDVQFIRPHCGCTGSDVDLTTPTKKILQFQFKESDTQHLTQVQIDNYYSDLKYPFTKQITVYFKDDKPLYITNEKGEKDYNPGKSQVNLYFTGEVDLRNFTPLKTTVP